MILQFSRRLQIKAGKWAGSGYVGGGEERRGAENAANTGILKHGREGRFLTERPQKSCPLPEIDRWPFVNPRGGAGLLGPLGSITSVGRPATHCHESGKWRCPQTMKLGDNPCELGRSIGISSNQWLCLLPAVTTSEHGDQECLHGRKFSSTLLRL